ncbi:hypothetical protein [Nocardioides sp. SR21]|uniref:hypothetical protein n=1 Tax=Nocardioides sp. SR21 TaxID=2919501 RepID=UPI001FAAC594|nr:hypothetical protein [Nocardioides sp. SR21]
MLERRQCPGPGEHEQVALRLRELRSARAHVATARHDATLRWKSDVLRAELLSALEGYAAAIVQIGAPVPSRLRLEIDLYRGLQNRG